MWRGWAFTIAPVAMREEDLEEDFSLEDLRGVEHKGVNSSKSSYSQGGGVGSFAMGADKPIWTAGTAPRPWSRSIRPEHLSPSAAHGHPRVAKMVKPRTLNRYTTTLIRVPSLLLLGDVHLLDGRGATPAPSHLRDAPRHCCTVCWFEYAAVE